MQRSFRTTWKALAWAPAKARAGDDTLATLFEALIAAIAQAFTRNSIDVTFVSCMYVSAVVVDRQEGRRRPD